MKKLLALVLSLLLVASCMAFAAVASEETTAAEDTTAAAEDTTAAAEDTTEEVKNYSNTLLVFNSDAQSMKIISAPNGINKAYYNSEWEGARLKIQDPQDPYVTINWSSYIKKADLEKVDSQAYPFIVFKLKIDGYVDDFELFYCAGTVAGADPAYASQTDYPAEGSGEIEYIIYDLTGDCEGTYNQFRFDPMGADEDTLIYLYEMALFATWEEAEAYAGYDAVDTEEETETEEVTDAETEEKTEEETEAETDKPTASKPEEKKDCNSVISLGAIVAIVSLGVVCIKKKD